MSEEKSTNGFASENAAPNLVSLVRTQSTKGTQGTSGALSGVRSSGFSNCTLTKTRNHEHETVREHFREYFIEPTYDGCYNNPASDIARQSFSELTNGLIMWAQVHGDHKDIIKRAEFRQYPHWSELYDCVRSVLKCHADLDTEFLGAWTCARIMGDAMALLKKRYGKNAPVWWLPIMQTLRGQRTSTPIGA
jgi:hypothetical protein